MTRLFRADSRRGPAGLCVALLVLLAACERDSIQFPTSDSTPPIIEWTVLNESDNSSQTSSVPAAMDVGNAADIRVTCKAWDYEGGIKSITTTGMLDTSCISNGRLDHQILAPLSTNHSKLPSGMVNTGSFTVGEYHLQLNGCDRYSGELQLTSFATNYLGRTTRSDLSVTFLAP